MGNVDAIALLTALATLITASAGLIYQLRRFRAEIVSAVERHMELTAQNRRLLEHIDAQLDITHPHP